MWFIEPKSVREKEHVLKLTRAHTRGITSFNKISGTKHDDN